MPDVRVYGKRERGSKLIMKGKYVTSSGEMRMRVFITAKVVENGEVWSRWTSRTSASPTIPVLTESRKERLSGATFSDYSRAIATDVHHHSHDVLTYDLAESLNRINDYYTVRPSW